MSKVLFVIECLAGFGLRNEFTGVSMQAMNRTIDQPLGVGLKSFSWYHLPVLLYGVGILALSSIPNLSTPGLEFEFSDKLVHLTEYAVFAALLLRSMTHRSVGAAPGRRLIRAAIYLSIFATVDEMILQRFVEGRYSDLYDLAADLSGVCLGLAAASIVSRFRSGRAG